MSKKGEFYKAHLIELGDFQVYELFGRASKFIPKLQERIENLQKEHGDEFDEIFIGCAKNERSSAVVIPRRGSVPDSIVETMGWEGSVYDQLCIYGVKLEEWEPQIDAEEQAIARERKVSTLARMMAEDRELLKEALDKVVENED
jgi:hypothetical protein